MKRKKNVLELLEYINQATQTLIGWMCDGNESMNEVLPYSILLLLLLSVLFIHSQLIHYVLPHLMMCGVCVCVWTRSPNGDNQNGYYYWVSQSVQRVVITFTLKKMHYVILVVVKPFLRSQFKSTTHTTSETSHTDGMDAQLTFVYCNAFANDIL